MTNEKNKLGGLVITDVLLSQSQTCLWREERGQSMILVALRDPKTNESGHLLYCLETDKRDCLEEETWTDNPELFANEHPEAYELQDLLGLSGKATQTKRTEAIDEVLGECWAGSLVVYKEGSAGWGLYAEDSDADDEG